MKHHFIYILILLLALSACSLSTKTLPRPNIVLVLTDDQGWGDVGFNGNKIISTPTLDSLASESIVFDRFYVSPVCAPTRASLLTGRYHLATGASWVTHRKEVMRESETTIGELFKTQGYKTAYFGKWHNGAQYPHSPNGQGFDLFFGFCAGHWNNYFDTELNYNYRKVKTKGYIADVVTDSVNAFIKNAKEPFLAYVAYNTPHTPYQVADEYYENYKQKGLDNKTAAIYGMCENIDDNVQRIQNALKSSGKLNNTIFIYLSDNGPNYIRYNGGFKGRKAQVHEGGVRVPFLIHYPNKEFMARRIKNNFGTHLDILPTLADLCNIPVVDSLSNGISLVPVMVNPAHKNADRLFFSHHIISEKQFCASVRTNDYLLTCYPNDTSLYNLYADPYQMNDIALQRAKLVDSLISQYENWLVEVSSKGLEPEPIHIGVNPDCIIEFPAHEANLYGDLKFAGGAGWANDWVYNFSNKNDIMLWEIKVGNVDTYTVDVKYACTKNDVGKRMKFSIGEKNIVKSITKREKANVLKSYDRVPRSEVYDREWGMLNFGEIEIDKTSNILTLGYMGDNNSDIQIKELILNPIR